MSKTIIALAYIGILFSCQTRMINENPNRRSATPQTVSAENTNANRSAIAQTDYSPTPSVIKISEFKSRIGNVESFTEGLCLKIQNNDLKAGDKIQVIITGLPQKTGLAEVVEKSTCTEPESPVELNTSYTAEYILKQIDGSSLERSGYGIGLVNSINGPKIKDKLVSVDLDNDKKDEYFRECTSNEGLHLTIWKGKPLAGKRIWHSYYHFNYDTEPDCKEKDYEGTN